MNEYSAPYEERRGADPRGNLPALVTAMKAIGADRVSFGARLPMPLWSLHVNIMKEQLPDAYWHKEVNEGIADIFRE